MLSKSLPEMSGTLTKELRPIWDKKIFLNNINNYIALTLSITAFACLLYFMYILGTKNNSSIRDSLLSTTIYLILMVIIGTITHITNITLYGNTLLWFRKSIGYIVLIIIVGTVRQIFIKLKERGIANE